MAQVERLDGHLFGEDQPCFGCGPKNPLGFRLKFQEDGEAIFTRFLAGPHHQGPLGVMHGGLVATVADETAGWAVIAKLGKFGFTTSFEAKYRRPVRIGVETECRAWFTKESRRVVRVRTVMTQAGAECFSADFTFAVLGRQAAEQLMGTEIPEQWARFCR
ncbi:MAG TPA: PaaI family thioesterase [Myxococcales bacterium]